MKAKKVELLSVSHSHSPIIHNVALQQLPLRLLAFEMRADTKKKTKKKKNKGTRIERRKKNKWVTGSTCPYLLLLTKLHNSRLTIEKATIQ